jgi:hypothetical protein
LQVLHFPGALGAKRQMRLDAFTGRGVLTAIQKCRNGIEAQMQRLFQLERQYRHGRSCVRLAPFPLAVLTTSHVAIGAQEPLRINRSITKGLQLLDCEM